MKLKFSLILLLLLFVGQSLFAQQEDIPFGGWYTLSASKNLNDNGLSGNASVLFRNWDVIGELQQAVYGAGLAYKVENINLKIAGGYHHFDISDRDDGNTIIGSENRTYISLLAPHKFSERLSVDHRIMFEQRWLDNQDFRTRFRVMQNGKWALTEAEKTSTLILQNDIFLNGQQDIGNGNQVSFFDQNRTMLAVQKPVNDWITVRIGARHHIFNNFNRQLVDGAIMLKF